MQNKFLAYVFVVMSSACIAMAPRLSFAQEGVSEITVKDTSGFTRAVSDVDGMGEVKFELVDAAGAPAEGVEVTLTNAVTGETLTGVTANGTVAFEGVSSGTWTVASTAQGVTFTNVAIASTTAAAVAGTTIGGFTLGSVIAGGAVATGVGFGIAEATDSSSNNDELSPSS